jgi:hypothetical protein
MGCPELGRDGAAVHDERADADVVLPAVRDLITDEDRHAPR